MTEDGCYVVAADTGAHVPWDCVTYFMCEPRGHACECDADGCTAGGILDRDMSGSTFDLTIEDGGIARGSYQNFNVRFDIEDLSPPGGAGGAP